METDVQQDQNQASGPAGELPQAVECPFLGIDEDSGTSFRFSTDENRCWRLKRPAEIALSHQSKYCFSGDFAACPVYTSGKLSSGIRLARSRSGRGAGPLLEWRLGVLLLEALLVLAAVAGAAVWWWLTPAAPQPTTIPAHTHTPIPTLPALAAPEATLVPTARKSPAPAAVTKAAVATRAAPSATKPVSTPQPSTGTAPTSSSAGLDQPVGPLNLLAHQVAAGEDLAAIAARFATTAEVLRKVNGLGDQDAVQAGQILVVPQGLTDPNRLPRLVAFQTVRDTDVAGLASQLHYDLPQVKMLNALGSETLVAAGRWLFLPVP